MSTDPSNDVVEQYHQRWTTGDVDGAMELVADDIVCHAPGQDVVGKAAYREIIAGFAPLLTGVDEIAVMSDGEHVARFYRPQTEATDTAVAAEHFTVRDGRIVQNVLVFDRLSYAPPS